MEKVKLRNRDDCTTAKLTMWNSLELLARQNVGKVIEPREKVTPRVKERNRFYEANLSIYFSQNFLTSSITSSKDGFHRLCL